MGKRLGINQWKGHSKPNHQTKKILISDIKFLKSYFEDKSNHNIPHASVGKGIYIAITV